MPLAVSRKLARYEFKGGFVGLPSPARVGGRKRGLGGGKKGKKKGGGGGRRRGKKEGKEEGRRRREGRRRGMNKEYIKGPKILSLNYCLTN